nr:retrovirus-related Pol polyprotein from transposon TNT 1-94 [Tanacetum cinerariifolium]
MTHWLCGIENTVEDRIMDSGAWFYATYCKEELERFKLCLGNVRLAVDKTLDIEGIRDVILKTYFSTSWTLKDVKYILGLRRRWFGEAEEPFLHNVSKDKKIAETAAGVTNGNVMLKMVPETPLQFGVAERLSPAFKAKSTGIRAEAPKMLWEDSVSMVYLIYRIPYVSIGLRIPEEEWKKMDTSLAHLKVFGCDSFVKVKDVYNKAMKCKFIGSGSDEMQYSFWDTKSHQVIQSRDITFVDSIYGSRFVINLSSLTKPIQKSQMVLVVIPENLAENNSIVAEHTLSSKITQSPGKSSDTSEGCENSRSFEDSGGSDKESSKDGASSKDGGFKTPQVRRSTRESRASVRYTKSLSHLAKNIKVCSWAKLVRILISEGSLSLLKILGTKSLAAIFTGDEREVEVLRSFN